MSGRVQALTTLFGVVLIGGVLLPNLAAAQSSSLDNCVNESGDVAIAACNAAIKENPHDAEAYHGRGSAFARKGENDRALADYSQAIKLSPEYAMPYFNRGLVLESKNQLQQALSDYKRAAELDPSDDDSTKAIARVAAALKNGSSVALSSGAAATSGSAPANSDPVTAVRSALPTTQGSMSPAARGAASAGTAAVSASTRNAVPTTRAPISAGSGSVSVSASRGTTPASSRYVPASAPVSSDPVAAETESIPAGSEPVAASSGSAVASTQGGWSTTGAAIAKWLSNLRSSQTATSNTSARVEPDRRGPSLQAPPSSVLSNNSIAETQEYWNDQMALANGGASDTRRIIALERLGELQSSGILTKQEFEREKRRILGE